MIQDEFTGRKDVSRARIYQLRHQRDGLCILCPLPATNKFHCAFHAEMVRERQRKISGCVKRNFGAASYRFFGLERSVARLGG